ncbi:MAG: hypothetical protein ACRDRU_00575 [Pseudonocardiaceae bacterium]
MTGEHGMSHVLDTIPVLPGGWTDLAEIRQLGQKWVQATSTSPAP